MSTARTIVDTEEPPRGSECWCCGLIQDAGRMVHLGNHPEVAICVRCAYSIKNWARAIEDQSRTGYAVRARDQFRRLRREIMRRHLHQNKWIGRPLRWLGRRLP